MVNSKAIAKAIVRLHDLNPDGKDEGLTKAETACYILDGLLTIVEHNKLILEATREDWQNMKYSNHKEDLKCGKNMTSKVQIETSTGTAQK